MKYLYILQDFDDSLCIYLDDWRWMMEKGDKCLKSLNFRGFLISR